MGDGGLYIRTAVPEDDLAGWLAPSWGGATMAVHGEVFDLRRLPALVAISDGRLVGALTYAVRADRLEIVSCDARPPGCGTGRALVTAASDTAGSLGLPRLALTTTNDNLPALGFWQALGFHLTALRPGAVAAAWCASCQGEACGPASPPGS